MKKKIREDDWIDAEPGESNWDPDVDPISEDGTTLKIQGFTRRQQDLVERIVDMELRNVERQYTDLQDKIEALADEKVTLKEKLEAAKAENAKLRGKILVLETRNKTQADKYQQELANLRGIDAHIHVRRPR